MNNFWDISLSLLFLLLENSPFQSTVHFLNQIIYFLDTLGFEFFVYFAGVSFIRWFSVGFLFTQLRVSLQYKLSSFTESSLSIPEWHLTPKRMEEILFIKSFPISVPHKALSMLSSSGFSFTLRLQALINLELIFCVGLEVRG